MIKILWGFLILILMSGCGESSRKEEEKPQNPIPDTEKINIKKIEDYPLSEIRITNLYPEEFTIVKKYKSSDSGRSLLISETDSRGHSLFNTYNKDGKLIRSRDFFSDGFGIQTDYVYSGNSLMQENSTPFTVENETLKLAANPFIKKYIYRENLLSEIKEGSLSTLFFYRPDGSLKEKRWIDSHGNPVTSYYNSREKVIRTNSLTPEGTKEETLFYYNISDRLIKKALYREGDLYSEEISDWTFFSDGNTKTLDRYSLTISKEETKYTYTDKALLSSKESPSGVYSYSYDPAQRKVQEIWKSGNRWSVQKWEYNSSGTLLSSSIEEQPGIELDGDQGPVLLKEYTDIYYNKNGNPEKIHFNNNSGLSTEEIFQYNKNGELLFSEKRDDKGTLKKSQKNIFDSNNRIKQTVTLYSNGRIITDYIYNEDGNLMETIQKSNDETLTIKYNTLTLPERKETIRGKKQEIIVFTYTDNGLPLSEEKYNNETLTDKTTYIYNKQNKPVSQKIENIISGEYTLQEYRYGEGINAPLISVIRTIQTRQDILFRKYSLDSYGNYYLEQEKIYGNSYYQKIENKNNWISRIKRYNASDNLVRIEEYFYEI